MTPPPAYARLPAIMQEVVASHGVNLEHVLGPFRFRPLVRARQEFCWRARVETGIAQHWIARFLNRDRTTISYAIQQYQMRVGK